MYCGFLWGNPLSRYDRQFDSARGLCASMPFPGLRYHPRMPDADDKLTPADPREVVTALSLGLTSGRQLGSPFAAAARTSAERRALASPPGLQDLFRSGRQWGLARELVTPST